MASIALRQINHIVLLMLENRSFDQMLGYLYAPDNAPPFHRPPRDQPFDGVAGKWLSNPIPPGIPGAVRQVVSVSRATSPNVPTVDAAHDYADVNTQLYGTIIPPGNTCPPFKPPYNAPADSPPSAMNGFAANYIQHLACTGHPITYDMYQQIMQCHTPDTVPVLSHLARAYGVSDRYFSSVPGETLPNRFFSLAATSGGLVMNEPYRRWAEVAVPTIFNRMEAARWQRLRWHVYYDTQDVVPLTWLAFPSLRPYLFTHFAPMHRFYADAQAGRLPHFSLIEPRFWVRRNSQHPPGSVTPGEQLISAIYRALRSSPNWEQTLLVITYDEHGGCYDHVPPPPAVPPTPGAPPGQNGFHFDRLGVRVPLVLVSPWVAPGTVFRARDGTGLEVPLDHTSVIKTVTTRFGLPSLTARDAAASDLGEALTLTAPRQDRPLIPAPERFM